MLQGFGGANQKSVSELKIQLIEDFDTLLSNFLLKSVKVDNKDVEECKFGDKAPPAIKFNFNGSMK